MRIEKLEIKGFGKLKNVSMTFDKGLNIIFGNNEAGKSTLQWFIKAMFFGLKGGKASKEGILPPLKRFKPWGQNDYAGFMEYRLDNDQLYRIGRNFSSNSVRVFDSLFNDVTNSFDASKEKGIHFAEKHLGLNEMCFDKTVFIRQMEAKIGEEGSKELYNRIMNITETGFEDVSFKKAQEALKEALKNHVGTEKTSTRPLDKVLEKLTELRNRREELINKRNSMFVVENELSSTITVRANLQDRKAVLENVKKLIDLQNRIEKNNQIKTQAQDILDSINSDEEELKLICERTHEINKTREEFDKFSTYDSEDIDELDRNYLKLLDKINARTKLKVEINNKERELYENRKCIESILAFSELGEGIENEAIEINRTLEQLKKEYDKGNLELLNEKIGAIEKKVKKNRLLSVFSAVACLVFLGIGFVGMNIGYVAAAASFILTIVLLQLKVKGSKELSVLLDEKRMSFININSITEEITKKQNMLAAIYMKVCAAGIEDFLRLKAEYDAESKLIAALNGEISRLESESAIALREIYILKDEILSKLIEAGVIDNGANEFEEEHIKSFKNGIRRYKGIEPSIKYAGQRLEDVNRSLEKHYKNAAALCESTLGRKEDLQNKIVILESELQQLTQGFTEGMSQVKDFLCEGSYARLLPEIACTDDIESLTLLSGDFSRRSLFIEEEYGKVCEELESTLLNIREYETLLKSISGDEAELQKIEEEMEELHSRKCQLEDINISLKTALDVLTEASEEIQKDFAPVLNYKMTDAIKRITAGKYYDLRADSILSLNTLAPETGDVVAVSALSGGTVDQMYLALRLSVADMVSQTGEKLPFIMDEVFAQYDDIRTKETFQYLKELSEQRQIIFFTCKGREVEIASQVFENVNIMELK